MSRLLERLQSAGEVLNPVLVREVRQALRGRFFLISFALVLTCATLFSIGTLLLNEEDAQVGQALFSICLSFLVIAVCYVVPIGAFHSLGAEHDEQTRDLLVLSNLSPGKIVRGKFLSSFLLTVLFTVSLTPFISLTALLRGVDLYQIVTQVTMILMKSALFTMGAICLSSLAPNRSARVVLMLVMVFFFLMADAMVIPMRLAMGGGMSAGPFVGRGELPAAALAFGVIGLFAYTLARGRFTHVEENRSTPLRVQVTVTLVLVNGILLLFPDLGSGSFSIIGAGPHVIQPELLFVSLFGLSFAALVFSTEPSRLGRRVRTQVPRARTVALLSAPFLPGGGRAVVWYLLNAGGLILLAAVSAGIAGELDTYSRDLQAAVLGMLATLGYLLWPSALLSGILVSRTARALLVLTPIGLILISTIGFEASRNFLTREIGYPVWGVLSPVGLLSDVSENGAGASRMAVIVIVLLALFSLLLNMVRIFREWREVLHESRRVLPSAHHDG